jgi:CRP-like cAMP-binding protein
MSKCEQCIGREFSSLKAVNLTAIALDDMQVCSVPKNEIMGFFDKNNQFSMNVMKTICDDLKESDSQMVNMAQKTVK